MAARVTYRIAVGLLRPGTEAATCRLLAPVYRTVEAAMAEATAEHQERLSPAGSVLLTMVVAQSGEGDRIVSIDAKAGECLDYTRTQTMLLGVDWGRGLPERLPELSEAPLKEGA